MQVDAIVNTANEDPVIGDGVDSAVYNAAGWKLLMAERKKIGHLDEGQAAITPGFHLNAKFIIHAVSPFYYDGESKEEEKLRSCYKNSLALAKAHGCTSIAFPLISTGSYGYPKEEGMRIAVDEIHAFLLKNEMLIYLVVFDLEASRLGLSIYPDLEAYIDNHYVCDKRQEEYGDRYFGAPGRAALRPRAARPNAKAFEARERAPIEPCEAASLKSYDEFQEEKESALSIRMKHLADSFQQYLFYLIQSKGLSNAQVYKRAIITKQTFSKIKNNEAYHPDKATAMRLCVGAGLNIDETKDLLARAGYALSPCDKRDIIFSYFIEKEIYDMIEIDIALEDHGLPCFIE